MDTKIHISIHRIQKILKTHISKKFRYNAYVGIASVVHIMSRELIEIAMEKALENNRYQVTLDHLSDAINQYSDINILEDDTLTLCLLRHSDIKYTTADKKDYQVFKNYIKLIKKDIIDKQLDIIGKTHEEKITISKQIKEIVSVIIIHHIIKLCGLIKYYTDFNQEKTIRYETILLIYSIWMKSLNVPDKTITQFHQAVQLKIDHYKN